ncbi:MAG: hypothetical protein R3E89_05715 [Thiolinea sp.]
MAKVSKTFQYGQHTVTMETGEVARQASTAIMITMDETTLCWFLWSVARKPRQDQDFFR